jgi:cell shape-determining protein MreD
MRIAIGIFLLLLAALLQTTLISRIALLQGFADLVLVVMIAWMLQSGNHTDWKWGIPAGLIVGYASALPDFVPLAGYIAAAAITQLLSQRIWQLRLLTLLSATLLGTLAIHVLTLGYMFLNASPIDAVEALNLITVPTMLLNLILILPTNGIMGELVKLLDPTQEPA